MVPKFIDEFIIGFLKKKGYVRLRNKNNIDLARRLCICNSNSIDMILDVGANEGQFALEMRDLGYTGKIISFEPVKEAFKKITYNFNGDLNWKGINLALSNQTGIMNLNISENSVSSSFLNMRDIHKEYAQKSKYIGIEEVEVSTLDIEFNKIYHNANNIWLKIDVQGFEMNVLEGAIQSLSKIKIVQVEVSLVPLYDNEPSLLNIIEFMLKNGFDMIGFESGFQHPNNGSLFQVDILFQNKIF